MDQEIIITLIIILCDLSVVLWLKVPENSGNIVFESLKVSLQLD